MSLARSAEQEQFAASLHDMLAAADVPGAARQWAARRPGPGSGAVARARRAGRHRAGGAGALGRPRRQPRWTRGRLRGTRASRGARAGGRVGRRRAGAAHRLLDHGKLADHGQLADRQDLCAGWLAGLAAGDLIATLALPPWLPYAVDADAAGLVLLAEAGAAAGSPRRAPAPVGGSGPVAVRGHAAIRRWPDGPAVADAAARALDFGRAGLRGAAARRGPRPAGGQRQARRAAGAVRPADRGVPGGQAPARRRGDRA